MTLALSFMMAAIREKQHIMNERVLILGGIGALKVPTSHLFLNQTELVCFMISVMPAARQ